MKFLRFPEVIVKLAKPIKDTWSDNRLKLALTLSCWDDATTLPNSCQALGPVHLSPSEDTSQERSLCIRKSSELVGLRLLFHFLRIPVLVLLWA